MVVKLVLIAPVIIGVILILVGVFFYIRRTKLGIHTVGVVTGINKSSQKKARIKVETESPIVRYTVKGQEYTCPAIKHQQEGIVSYKKGQKIEIRVSRKNPRIFNPVTKGAVLEPFFIFGGIFIILAYIIMYVRYF